MMVSMEVLDSSEMRPWTKYPWDEWFDGQVRVAVYETDFSCTVGAFKSAVLKAAKRRRLTVKTRTYIDRIVFQAILTPPDPPAVVRARLLNRRDVLTTNSEYGTAPEPTLEPAPEPVSAYPPELVGEVAIENYTVVYEGSLGTATVSPEHGRDLSLKTNTQLRNRHIKSIIANYATGASPRVRYVPPLVEHGTEDIRS